MIPRIFEEGFSSLEETPRMSVQELLLFAERRKRVRFEASETTDERTLVAQAKCGSSTAFGELYERNRAKVYHTILRVLRHREDAEDAVQRCFKLVRRKHNLKSYARRVRSIE